jgi:hypothetical protein
MNAANAETAAAETQKPPSLPRRIALYHFTAFIFHGSHFFPYSAFAYPLIALGRARAARLPAAWRYALWTLYFAAVAVYATRSYFFTYSFAWAANPGYTVLSGAIALAILVAASAGRPHLGWAFFLLLLAFNLAAPAAYPFAWRLSQGLFPQPLLFAAIIIAILIIYGIRRGRLLLLFCFSVFFYTSNSPFPFIIIFASAATVIESLRTRAIRSFNPAVQAVSAFHLLLILGFSQFYSTSLPRALDSARPPRCVTPIYIYGSAQRRLPPLAAIDNRFLSADPRGRFLFFGTRMSRPDLFRIDSNKPARISSQTIAGVADNAVFEPDGSRMIVGSFNKNELLEIDTDPFRISKTAPLPFRPIRLRLDPAHRRIFAISEFEDRQAHIYDADTLEPKGSIARTARDRNSRDLVIDPTAGRIAISQWLDLVLYSSKTLRPLDRARTDNRGLGRMAIDPRRKIIFLTHTRSGRLLCFSYKNDKLKRTCSVPLGAGIRDIAFDPVHNRVALANYFSGVLTCYSLETGSVSFRIHLGSRMRHIEFTPDGLSILTTTFAGGFIVNTNLANGRLFAFSPNSFPFLSSLRMPLPPHFFKS